MDHLVQILRTSLCISQQLSIRGFINKKCKISKWLKYSLIVREQIMDCFRSMFMFQKASKIRICDMCENGKPWFVSKMVWVSIENKQSVTVLILEKQ